MLKKIFFIPLLLIVFTIFLGSLFKINTINCTISQKNCSPEIYKKLEIFKGKSIFFVDFDKELSADNSNFETILLENYKKYFPGTVNLNFSEEKVLYELNLGNEHYFISEFGNILGNNQGINNLTKVNLANNQEKHSKIAEIINISNKNKFQVESIDWNNDEEIIIKILDNPKLIFDIQSINTKINSIGLLLNSREIKEYKEPIKEIDLRFDLPVLRTSQ